MNSIENQDHTKSQSNKTIAGLYNYLIKKYQTDLLTEWFDLIHFEQDVDAGLYFSSNIPVGYGVGSPGALIAALFEKYSKGTLKEWKSDLSALKTKLSMLESYFHGKSSGLDPLMTYLNNAISLQNNRIMLDKSNFSDFNLFLIDTGKSRSTGDLVNFFHEKCLNKEYLNVIQTRLIKSNNQCIHFLRKGEKEEFFNSLKELSVLQLEYFREMILPEYESLWIQGLEFSEFYLKLCGAGGGGYLLGFTPDKENIKRLKNKFESRIIEI